VNQVQNDPKKVARETIARLEGLIEEYEKEMKYGQREIDVIQEDIKRTKAEILSIQRNKLNNFYFF
jgi:hypothetical protein